MGEVRMANPWVRGVDGTLYEALVFNGNGA
jgi:hypothetical protein